jgi:uncharacterized membrane protein YbhN (UPF0104 family)
MNRSAVLGRGIRLLAVAAALAAGGLAVADRWSSVHRSVSRIGPGPIVATVGLAAVFELATVLSWRAVLAGMGNRLPLPGASRVVLLSALGKYIPGSVWPYLAQVEMSRRYDVPRSRSAAASVTTVMIGLVTGLVLAAATVPWYSLHAAEHYWPVFLAIVPLVAVLHPSVFNRLMDRALHLARRPPLADPVTGRAIGRGAAWSALAWLAAGLQVWILAASVSRVGPSSVLLCLGGYALAWSAGFLVVIAPAGAGVRDAALTAILSSVMPTPAALSVALICRAVSAFGDLGAAAVAGLLRAPSSEGEHDPQPDQA